MRGIKIGADGIAINLIVRNTAEAKDVLNEMRRVFPLVDVEETCEQSFIRDFGLDLDENGRNKVIKK